MSTDQIKESEASAEYNRPPVYQRPVGGIVRVMDRMLKQAMTQADSLKEDGTWPTP